MSIDGYERDMADWREESHAALCEKWGKPELADAAGALNAIGVAGRDPYDVVAFRYPSRAAAEEFAAADLKAGAYRTLGIADSGSGAVSVIEVPLR